VRAADVTPEGGGGQAPTAGAATGNRSEVVRSAETPGRWDGIPVRRYRPPSEAAEVGDAWPAVTRQLLAGGPESSCSYELRYFEIAPGGRSAHERHQHEHAVLVLRGEGEVLLAGERHTLRSGDLVRVAPGDPHQFKNTGEEPFGFLCVVDAERDRPVPLDDDDAPSCSLDPR